MDELADSKYGFYTLVEDKDFSARIYIDHHNKRLKLLDHKGVAAELQTSLRQIAAENRLGKIIGTVRDEAVNSFTDCGYSVEGIIEGFFKGSIGHCISMFTDSDRSKSDNKENEDLIVKKALDLKNSFKPGSDQHNIHTASKKDIKGLSLLFDKVFQTYPTPMNNPEYIEKAINNNVLFKIVYIDGQLVSAASADMDIKLLNAEITDCATYPEYRGKGLLSHLVYSLEQELKNRGFISLFSLSRALSTGINIVLSKHGYDYSGRLINNCNIMGKYEDMNIWVKRLI